MDEQVEITKDSLQNLKNKYDDDLVVAFLGDTNTGKTVCSALIQDTAVNYLREITKDEHYGFVTEGNDIIYRTIKTLNDGVYTSPTPKSETIKIKIKINSTKSSESTNIYLHDISGEHSQKFLESGIDPGQELARAQSIINESTSVNDTYGQLSHLIIADVYIILIDCTKYKEWASHQMRVSTIIQNIFKLKNILGDIHYKKFHSPVALIFSKYDTLPRNEKKTTDELFKQFPNVRNVLEEYHNKPDMFRHYKSNIKSEKLTLDESRKINQELLKNNHARSTLGNNIIDLKTIMQDELKNKEDALIEFNSAQTLLNNTPKNSPAFTDATNALNEARLNQDNIVSRYNSTKMKLTQVKKQLSDLKHFYKCMIPNNDSYAPVKPLTYNHKDYAELITWLVNMDKIIKGK